MTENDIKSDYLQELMRIDIPQLPMEYEHELGYKIALGDDDALEELVKHNLRLVPYMVSTKLTAWDHGKTPSEDLIAIGNEALLLAAMNWIPKTNVRFSSYACVFIKQHVLRELDNTENVIRLPVNIMSDIKKMNYNEQILFQSLGRKPTIKELANVLETDTTKIYQLKSYLSMEPIGLEVNENDTLMEDKEE
jgi:RNA polymerase primary sigma factor